MSISEKQDQAGVKLAWKAHSARLGPSMTVQRVLPGSQIEAVGPFVFFDHVGPMPTPRQNLAAHPHAGIEVITYLMEGCNEHRDSLGHRGTASSGGAQWLTAGRGMLHAERIGFGDNAPANFHAVQLWTRLPRALEDCAPSYRAVPPTAVPETTHANAFLRLVAGTHPLFDAPGPVELQTKALLMDISLTSGTPLDVALDSAQEFGIYVLSGELSVAGGNFAAGSFIALTAVSQLTLLKTQAEAAAQCLLLGGAPAERPLVYAGSFVFSSQHKADAATRAFYAGDMGCMDGVPF